MTNATATIKDDDLTLDIPTPTEQAGPTCSVTTDDAFLVCSGLDCGGIETESCTVECYGEACGGAHFEDSSVACLGEETCTEAKFTRSLVDCVTSKCKDTTFFSSALRCDSSGDSYDDSCEYALLSRCTCCDGGDCPGDPATTTCEEDPEEFCANRSFMGRNCKDWGHPFCDDVDVPSLPPFHSAEGCSLGEEIVFCDEGSNGCLGLSASDCTVSCHGKVCNQASFEDSFVQCFDRPIPGFFEVFPGEGCVNARFEKSIAVCQNSCVGATFEDSAGYCFGPSCTQTSFEGCSCCDGEGCPFGVPACEGNVDAICSRVIDGETCACRGFPLCEEAQVASCSGEGGDSGTGSSTSIGIGSGSIGKIALEMSVIKTKAAVPKSESEAKSKAKEESAAHETEEKEMEVKNTARVESEAASAAGLWWKGHCRVFLSSLFVISFLASF